MVPAAVGAPHRAASACFPRVSSAAVWAAVWVLAGSSDMAQPAAGPALQWPRIRRRHREPQPPQVHMLRPWAVEMQFHRAPAREDLGPLDGGLGRDALDDLRSLRLESGSDDAPTLGRRPAQVGACGAGACDTRPGSLGARWKRLLLSRPRPPSSASWCSAGVPGGPISGASGCASPASLRQEGGGSGAVTLSG
uniref:Putative secreted protein n=1 Tax=Ixodes ricinus TaxID=34613 RepID=A0A6B0V1L6_IXORI